MALAMFLIWLTPAEPIDYTLQCYAAPEWRTTERSTERNTDRLTRYDR